MTPAKQFKNGISWRDVNPVNGHGVGDDERQETKLWKTLYLYIVACLAFAALFVGIVNLQIVHGRDHSARSQRNRIEEQEVQLNIPCEMDTFTPPFTQKPSIKFH